MLLPLFLRGLPLRFSVDFAAIGLLITLVVSAEPLHLPTANRAIFEPGGEEKYFVGTPGKPWTSGTFGCVRSEGAQIHEGIDVKCLQRDKKGEPSDPVLAAADGTVAYVNGKSGLSNYGNYLLLRHRLEGIEVYSLYAHLRQIQPDLKVGQEVKAGYPVGTMGRTSNMRSAISKDRAHVHFELDLLINDRFAAWFQRNCPGQRNDHGVWNGQNLVGFDPRQVLLNQAKQGTNFSLLGFLRYQPELCHVLVRKTNFPWLRRYTPLIRRNPTAEKEGVAGYEIVLNFNGLPCQLIPRAASEIKSPLTVQLLSVNDAEQQRNPGRHFLTQRGGHWVLTQKGLNYMDLLTY